MQAPRVEEVATRAYRLPTFCPRHGPYLSPALPIATAVAETSHIMCEPYLNQSYISGEPRLHLLGMRTPSSLKPKCY